MKNDNYAMRAADKWGNAAAFGYQMVPDLLLKNQCKLGLNPTDMTVLLNVLMHWWYAKSKPFPRSTVIAARMGVKQRTVQRSLAKLQKLGLMNRQTETYENGIKYTVCDPAGLQSRLAEIANGELLDLNIEGNFYVV